MAVSVIYCEVICSKCGAMALESGWYSASLLAKLKVETKAWSRDSSGVICPDCAAKEKKNKQG